MFTENARGMVSGITLCIPGIICLVLMVRQFRQKGSVLSPLYFLAGEEEKGKMRQKRVYRAMGQVYLYLAVVLLLFAAYFLFDQMLFAYLGTTLCLCAALAGLLQIVAHK